MALSSVFKSLKSVLAAKNLLGDDALAQRAVILIQQTFALKQRAYEMGHAGAYQDCDTVVVYAALALGALDKAHHYAFLDVQELPVDVRNTFELHVARGVPVAVGDADELVVHAEQAYRSINAVVPTPSFTMTGLKHRFVLRGAHARAAIAAMGQPANQNAH